jgi:hypothetical protein
LRAEHRKRHLELGQAGIEEIGDRLTGRSGGHDGWVRQSVWNLKGDEGWDEITFMLENIVGTLRLTGGELHGVGLEVYEKTLDLVTRTSAALAELHESTRTARRRAAA